MSNLLSYKVEENLELRFVSERYSKELATIVQDNLVYLQEWLPWATEDYSVETANEFIKMCFEGFAKNEYPSHFIFYKENLVGGINFNNINKANQSAEIGYWLKKDSQGKGIVTKCCRELIEFGFNEMQLNRIVIKCATENTKSQKIPERLGFTMEGTARQAELLNGKFVDWLVYSMLREEWENI